MMPSWTGLPPRSPPILPPRSHPELKYDMKDKAQS